jgi:hypothetical protein
MKRFFLAVLLLIAGKASLGAQTIEIPFTGDYADPWRGFLYDSFVL